MLFSVIVPVHNIEKYLDECIKSVLCQDCYDYELILVDDGSTDNSGKICDYYVSNNPQIHCIHKCNEGLSVARNCGIDMAQGKYILFLDGDDYWALNTMLSELSRYINANSPDIIAFEGKTFWDNGSKKIINSERINKLSLSGMSSFNTFIKACLSCNALWGWYAWLYVIRKNIFDDINLRFPRQRTYEDAYLTWRILMKAKKIGTISKTYYMYRQGRDGAITNVKTYKPIRDYIWAIENNLHDIKYIDIEESVKKLLMGRFSNSYFTCCVIVGMLSGEEKRKGIKELEEKEYLMDYVILPRYQYLAKMTKAVGIKAIVEILSQRYRWKKGIKMRLLKFQLMKQI